MNDGAPAVKVRVGKFTSIGNFRDNNEDRLFVDENRAMFIVADGMGGQAAGEQASQIAVDVIPDRLKELNPGIVDVNSVRDAVTKAVVAANDTIIAQGVADPSVQNMGTTVVLAMLRGNKVYIAHVGDSRAYKVRDGGIETMTTDHNLAQALYDAKTITKEELKNHKFRHVLWKYLGSQEASEGPDLREFDVHAGDRIVLATDGLCGVLEDETVRAEVLNHTDPQKCAEDLVRLSLEQGSKDNVTCVVVFVEPA